MEVKTTARPVCWRRCGLAAESLMGAVGREIATQYGDARIFFEGIGESVDHFAIPAGGLGNIFPDSLTIGGEGIAIERAIFAEFAEYSREATGVEKIFHQVSATWLEIHETREMRC